MPLTPADVANVAFSKPPLGKRGYTEDEVDAFLDLVEAEMARLIEENDDLRNQVQQLDHQLRAASVNTSPHLAPLEPPRPAMPPGPPLIREPVLPSGDHNVQAAKVLDLAQEMADRMTGEATAEADRALGEARTKSEQLLFEARAKADGMVNDSRNRAETLLHDARDRAETLDRQSRKKAASLERDATRKHTEITAALSQEKTALEKQIDELRTFEHGYRSRLKTYLDSQLRELDGRGSSTASAASIRSQQGLEDSGFGAPAQTTVGPRWRTTT